MRYSFAALSMIMVGILALVIILVFQDVTVNNEADYYSLKEAMEASMIEAIDSSYYMKTGELKIVEQKFVSNFTRRFVNGTMGNSKGYVLEFYDIMESPPKATVIVKNATDMMVIDEEDVDIVNNLTGILEATLDRNSILIQNKDCGVTCDGNIKTETKTLTYYSVLPIESNSSTISYLLSDDRLRAEVSNNNIVGLRISKVKFLSFSESSDGNVKLGDSYRYYGRNENWKKISNLSEKLIGTNKNNCYSTGASISIDNALGDYQYNGDNYYIIRVDTKYDSDSISGCQDDDKVLVKYEITWKYDYCVE